MKKLHSLFLCFLLVTLSANSEFDELRLLSMDELMNVTITSSTGTERKLSDAPSIATVITAKQIERSTARTLFEVLQMVPGLHAYHSPEQVMKENYDIRGINSAYSAQILTLINGNSIDTVSNGSPTVAFTFPASLIKRVEIIRGPGSAIYGADAFSGVINIITKDADYLIDNSQVGVRYGSFNTTETYLNYGESFENFDIGINLTYIKSDGDRDRRISSDLQTTMDGMFATSVSHAPGPLETRYDNIGADISVEYENIKLHITAHSNRDSGTQMGAGQTLDPNGKMTTDMLIADLTYSYDISDSINWTNSLVYHYNKMHYFFNLFPAGTILPIGGDGNAFSGVAGGGNVLFTDGYIGNPGIKENIYTYKSTFLFNNFDEHQIRLGIGVTYAQEKAFETQNFGPGIIDGTVSPISGQLTDTTGTPFIFVPNEERTLYFLSLQDEITFSDKINLTAGVRYDYYDDFGGTLNPRLGLVWQTSDELSTKLLYGRAFRAPSFAELYIKNNPLALGNPDLDPEIIDMLELGFNYTPNKKLYGLLNFYIYEARDMIAIVQESKGKVSQNSINQVGAGFELELGYQLSDDLLFQGDYAYRWTEDLKTKAPATYIPLHIGNLRVIYDFNRATKFSYNMHIVSNIARAVTDTRPKVAGYAISHISLNHKIDDVTATLAVRNLLDKKYYEPSSDAIAGDLPAEGRSVFVELKYRF